ncbi:hypothetical protein [Aurantiacibacter aquimixticola]|uniref:Uncharacterized protein n=1 Tax=Aurantiacibacter aquimixticola TaxID=1958945 RepID=A0A419RQV7_9SPHN|nr:hypothetical protein [Aurantiacibacter aquimixticola]RJY08156.1 hypothetical protein D6201_01195 [Aurantiacibacter aquimixticola]
MTDRYEGKPFLRLLDSYVLDTIGHLDEANRKWLVEAEPFFRETFVASGGWRDIVAQRMQFPDGMDASIVEVWTKGRTKFMAMGGEELDPVEFTHRFVDTNFPH